MPKKVALVHHISEIAKIEFFVKKISEKQIGIKSTFVLAWKEMNSSTLSIFGEEEKSFTLNLVFRFDLWKNVDFRWKSV